MAETENIRRLEQQDRSALLSMLERTPIFHAGEVEIAMELIDIALTMPAQNDYHIYVFEREGIVRGYHCTGKRPLTDGVYDLYWIVVDPADTGGGAGSALLRHAEYFVKERNGRWLFAETSSRQDYMLTRNFYFKHGYQVLTHIPDFYRLGDGLVLFGKSFLN